MSQRLGVASLGSNTDDGWIGGECRQYSERTAHAIDEEVRSLLDKAYARAHQIIVEHRQVLDRLAGALLQWETLQGDLLESAFTGESDEVRPVSVHESHASVEGGIQAAV